MSIKCSIIKDYFNISTLDAVHRFIYPSKNTMLDNAILVLSLIQRCSYGGWLWRQQIPYLLEYCPTLEYNLTSFQKSWFLGFSWIEFHILVKKSTFWRFFNQTSHKNPFWKILVVNEWIRYVTQETWSGNVWNLFICFVCFGFIWCYIRI